MRTTCFTLLMLGFWSAISQQAIPFDSVNWEMGDGAFIEEYKGYPCLNASRSSILKDFEFKNGTIEYDMIIQTGPAFPGVQFRRDDDGNGELFYVRPHQSGNPDALQYTPVFKGLTGWQFYHSDGFSAAKQYHYDEWFHVKIVASGTKGEVYIEDMARPILVIHELKLGERAGKLSFAGPARYANLVVNKMDNPPLNGKHKSLEKAPPEVIQSYQVSETFAYKSVENQVTLPKTIRELPRQTLKTEHDGLANLSRLVRFGEGSDGVLAEFTIKATKSTTKRMDFGFSDFTIIYLNGQAIFSGSDPFRSRDYRFLGTVGYFDSVFLNLKKGDNVITFAVGETFGGWGVRARLDNLDGVEITDGK